MFTKLIVGFLTFLLTSFILINTYEVVFNKDIPFANAIAPLRSQRIINNTISYFENGGDKMYSAPTGSLGEPDYLYIPSTDSRVFVARERKIDGEWYYRPNNFHYISLNQDESGVTGDLLLYTTKGFRTIPQPSGVEIGDEIAVTNQRGKTTSFAVTDVQVLPLDETYIVPDSDVRQLVIIVDDPEKEIFYLFVAR